MAWITDLLARGPTYSFEFFPPRNDAEQATLVRTLRDLEPLAPSFVSVTYRGGRESRQRTYDLVTGMLRSTTLLPMAHLVCAAHTRQELVEILVAFRKAGVENLMALGGDPPAPGKRCDRVRPGFIDLQITKEKSLPGSSNPPANLLLTSGEPPV